VTSDSSGSARVEVDQVMGEEEEDAKQDEEDKEEADERRAEGEPAAAEEVPLKDLGKGGEVAKKGSTQKLAASKWAPGQKATWNRFIKQTDKMDGLANDEDNVIAQWAR
jgi:hypothetical protein